MTARLITIAAVYGHSKEVKEVVEMACHCICSVISAPKYSVVSQWDIHAAQWTQKHLAIPAQGTARPACLKALSIVRRGRGGGSAQFTEDHRP